MGMVVIYTYEGVDEMKGFVNSLCVMRMTMMKKSGFQKTFFYAVCYCYPVMAALNETLLKLAP